MKHNKKGILLVAMFFTVLLLPIGSFFVGADVENIENKTLHEKPKFNISTWQDYPQLYEAYYNDTIPYKKVFVNTYNRFVWNVFDESPADYVIKGKDGWLFYNSKYKNDGDELGDYQRTAKLLDADIILIVDKMKKLKSICDDIGAEFYVLIGPNKMEIYGDDFLPDAYKNVTVEKSRTEYVVEALQHENISVIYPKTALTNAKENSQVYYKLDTHWNSYGGYIAYREFMNQYNSAAEIELNSIYEYEKNYGDLAGMIQMNGLEDVDYKCDFKSDISIQTIMDEAATATTSARYRTVSDSPNSDRLLMYRDSFATALLPYLSKSFSEGYYLWSHVVDEQEIRNEQPDVLIFEIVERSVCHLPYVVWHIENN